MITQDLTKFENKILEVKYAKKAFSLHTEQEQNILALNLMMQISFITGWTMPVNEMLAIAKDNLIKKINESFSTFNFEEILFAFRNYGTTVEDWGKQFNLNLFDKVLVKYYNDRNALSKLEESKEAVEQVIYTKDETENYYRQLALSYFNRLLKGKIEDPNICVVEILKKDYNIKSDAELNEFIVNRLNNNLPFYEKY